MLYCFECDNVFDYSNGVNADDQCPIKDCCGVIKDIDENYLPIIKLLNEKGYGTEYCCSGHSYGDNSSPYIKFARGVENDLLVELPTDFNVEEYSEDDESYIVIRAEVSSTDPTERHKQILTQTLKLLHWAKNLPSLVPFNCYFVRVKKSKANKIKDELGKKYRMEALITEGPEGTKTIPAYRAVSGLMCEEMKQQMIQLAEDNECEVHFPAES